MKSVQAAPDLSGFYYISANDVETRVTPLLLDLHTDINKKIACIDATANKVDACCTANEKVLGCDADNLKDKCTWLYDDPMKDTWQACVSIHEDKFKALCKEKSDILAAATTIHTAKGTAKTDAQTAVSTATKARNEAVEAYGRLTSWQKRRKFSSQLKAKAATNLAMTISVMESSTAEEATALAAKNTAADDARAKCTAAGLGVTKKFAGLSVEEGPFGPLSFKTEGATLDAYCTAKHSSVGSTVYAIEFKKLSSCCSNNNGAADFDLTTCANIVKSGNTHETATCDGATDQDACGSADLDCSVAQYQTDCPATCDTCASSFQHVNCYDFDVMFARFKVKYGTEATNKCIDFTSPYAVVEAHDDWYNSLSRNYKKHEAAADNSIEVEHELWSSIDTGAPTKKTAPAVEKVGILGGDPNKATEVHLKKLVGLAPKVLIEQAEKRDGTAQDATKTAAYENEYNVLSFSGGSSWLEFSFALGDTTDAASKHTFDSKISTVFAHKESVHGILIVRLDSLTQSGFHLSALRWNSTLLEQHLRCFALCRFFKLSQKVGLGWRSGVWLHTHAGLKRYGLHRIGTKRAARNTDRR
jgi:hypothetical protein